MQIILLMSPGARYKFPDKLIWQTRKRNIKQAHPITDISNHHVPDDRDVKLPFPMKQEVTN